jgi:hypothetical protein
MNLVSNFVVETSGENIRRAKRVNESPAEKQLSAIPWQEREGRTQPPPTPRRSEPIHQ